MSALGERLASALFDLLLLLFPSSFRSEYEDEMRCVHRERLAEARRGTPRVRSRVFARVHFDLLRAGLLARFARGAGSRTPKERKGDNMFESLLNDLRHGARVARRNPGFTVLAVAMLALGIGAGTALFSLARAILLQPLPVPEPERVVRLVSTEEGRGVGVLSYPNFEDLRHASRSFEHLAVQRQVPAVLGRSGGGRELAAELVSEDYFAVFGAAPVSGRALAPADFGEAEGPVVVIGNRLWREDLGGASDIVGSRIEINRRTFTVVGVMPESFAGSYPAFRTEIWAPVTLHEQLRPLGIPMTRRGWGWLTGTGRLAEGVSLEQARTELATIGHRLEEEYPDTNRGVSFTLLEASPLPEDMRDASEGLLGGLAMIVALLLLAVCANVGGVLLGRALERQREISVRSSIGASRSRLVRLLLAEALVVAFAGATVGLAVAGITARLLVRILARVDGLDAFDPTLSFGLSTVAFAYGLSLATGLLFGLLPALRSARGSALGGLRNDPSLPGGVRARSWSALVIAQVAIAVLLLVGSGLLLRSVWRAEAFDPGFRTHGIALATLDLRAHGYDGESGRAFFRATRERLSALPGVTSVTWATTVPLGGGRDRVGLEIPGHRGPDGESTIPTAVSMVGPDYFETLDIAVLAGRDVGPGDLAAEQPRAAVVNRTFAERYFGSAADAVGETLGGPEGGRVPVVGVVADSKIYSLGEEPLPFVYFAGGGSWATFFVAVGDGAAGDARDQLGAVRSAIAEQDALLLPRRLSTLAELRRSSLFLQRALGSLTGLLAGLALLLTALGVYGAVSFGVARRRRELGLRMALGAWPARVARLVLARAARLVAIGLTLGGLGGLLAGRALSGLLFGVAAFDPATFAAAGLAMAAAVAVASYLPARRALGLDPLEALREE